MSNHRRNSRQPGTPQSHQRQTSSIRDELAIRKHYYQNMFDGWFATGGPRRNVYHIQADMPIRDAVGQNRAIGELLSLFLDPAGSADDG